MMGPQQATRPPELLPGWRATAVVFAGATGIALLSFWYRFSDVLARGGTEPFQIRFIEEFTGVFLAFLLLVPVVWLARTLHWRGVPWPRQVLVHIPVAAAFSVLHTSSLWGSRSLLFPLAGLGRYDYGEMAIRYTMELGIQIPVYILTVAAALTVEHVRNSQAQALRLARLEGELARARMANLEHQLRPHFLFNALNTISSVMYDDLGRADRILADLAAFLRRSLRSTDSQEVPLSEEVGNLELFLAIAQARFEERLDAGIEVEEEALAAAVPALLLQPLVENALHHGDPGEDRTAVVRVRAQTRNGRLLLEVTDNGPGTDAPLEALSERGIGLGTTRKRLELLYPGDHGFVGETRPEGGFRIRIEIPHRVAAPAAEPPPPLARRP